MRTVAIIQARMNSSRLPGKVLQDIAGQPMLMRVLERARRAKTVDDVIVATTTDPSDDPIEAVCRERGYLIYRGSMFDVLDRYYGAARLAQADVIVRVTADCPVIDPAVIDQVVEAFHTQNADFACNRLPPPWKRTWPIGLDTEVCSFAGLERAWKEAVLPYEREHVMPFFYDHGRAFQGSGGRSRPGLRHAALDGRYAARFAAAARDFFSFQRPQRFYLAGCAPSV